MSNTRPTKIVETPNGRKVEINTFITEREKESIQDIFLSKMEISRLQEGGMGQGASADISGMKGSAATEANHLTYSIMIVSIDGITENVLDTFLDMDSADTQLVKEAINEITEGSKKK